MRRSKEWGWGKGSRGPAWLTRHGDAPQGCGSALAWGGIAGRAREADSTDGTVRCAQRRSSGRCCLRCAAVSCGVDEEADHTRMMQRERSSRAPLRNSAGCRKSRLVPPDRGGPDHGAGMSVAPSASNLVAPVRLSVPGTSLSSQCEASACSCASAGPDSACFADSVARDAARSGDTCAEPLSAWQIEPTSTAVTSKTDSSPLAQDCRSTLTVWWNTRGRLHKWRM